ncbi:LOW QUALITY PROTEIN: hypothetical protein U9M48_004618 [Paspalum notatum var. saurae]|uniref:MULE transposase domain-containing protein n=1 Tax=Paspalum notatum var. saurae TaxID=547442 RepID=A0AAQ3PTN0_PASNO
MLIRNTSEWKMDISTTLQRGWPLAMLVQSIPKAIIASQAVENYGNTSAAMQEDGWNMKKQLWMGTLIRELQLWDMGPVVLKLMTKGMEVNMRRKNKHMRGTVVRQSRKDRKMRGMVVRQSRKDRMKKRSLLKRRNPEKGPMKMRTTQYPKSGENVNLVILLYMMLSGRSGSTDRMRYASNELLKKAVKLWLLSLKKKFKVVKSSPRWFPWRVHAYKGILKTHWKVSIVTEHTCYNIEVPKYNRNLTAAFMANEMYGRILDTPHFEPKKIIMEIELEHKYTISYAKAYRAKQKVFEMRFGTYEDSYDNLSRMLAIIAERNLGTYYDVMHFPNPEGGPTILQRVFFCLGPCVRAFQYYLPLLCIDGTFLTGKYKGTILTAIGVDGNNQVLPVAFAFVENENAESWYWFLERVKAQVVSSRSNVCLISDRHAEILDAIEKLQHGSGASPPIWPNNQQRKFNAIWKLLDELTAKHQAANPSASSSGTITKPFSQWIQDKPKVKWALLHDTNDRRYGIMTTNHTECYNMVMHSSRGIPLVGIIEFILYGCAKYFRERYMAISAYLSTPSVLFGKRITKYIETKMDKAQTHNARLMETRENRFEVSCRDRS